MINSKPTILLNMVIKEMQRNPFKLTQNTNTNRQSSVSAIFRINPIYINQQIIENAQQLYKPFYMGEHQNKIEENITQYQKLSNIFQELEKPNQNIKNDVLELLFIQRASNPKDRHSGQIAFPGGHVDGKENDFQAGVREIHEEIGIDLSIDNQDFYQFYLGKMPQNLFVRKNINGQNLFVNTHFFFLVQKQQAQELNFKIQEKEIQDVKFVDFSILLFPQKQSLHMIKWGNSKYILQFFPKIIKKVVQKQLQNLEYAEYPAINIGMNQPLWGLTFALENKKHNLSKLQQMIETPVINPKWKDNYKYGSLIEICIQKFNKRNKTSIYRPYDKIQNDYFRFHLFMGIVLVYYYIPLPSL